ncbi:MULTISPECIES: hypothetical protein [Microbacterium]|uniref:hypothetical protein n=1 Tax=Microbacterium TaxID=33882 RepID=UPI00046848D1|nr:MULTISPECIES: hypothetical protein [Microbacterium]AMG82747.1 hypothetical protein AXH82_04600 [Microbacterium sp. PAMC 28756]QXE29654.1 hypothetical protein IZR02_15050 [Microbacterium paraoxydans]
MTASTTSFGLDLGPIQQDWTIGELLAWLQDDARTHDPALREPLARIEAAVTGTPWPSSPSTVALIRSLAAASRSGGLARVRIAHFAPNPAGMEHSERLETSQVA